jgi:hypothetical protein
MLPLHHQPFRLAALLLLLAHACCPGAAADGGRFVYNGFAGANLTLDGAAAVAPNGLLVLTNGTLQTKDHAIHPSPLPFRDQGAPNATAARSFSTAFVFAIYGQYADLSSNGLAFFVAADRAVLSAALPGRFLGLLNDTSNGNRSAHVFAVELDTIFNAEFRDINSNHVRVDVNSLRSVNATGAGYYDDATGQFHNLSLISRNPMQVWVDYESTTARPGGSPWPWPLWAWPGPRSRSCMQTAVDLSDVVQGTVYVGFTSATAVLYSRHFVLGWSFALDGPAPPLDTAALPALPRAWPKPRSRVLEIVLPVASATLVLAVGVAAYSMAQRRLKYAELHEDWEVPFGPH